MTKNSEQKERLDYHGLSKFLDNLKTLFAFKTDTPTKLSQLVNDVGYKTTDTVKCYTKVVTGVANEI